MKNDRVTTYISKKQAWQQQILHQLREILHDTDPAITETLKWSAPYYEHDGKVAWMFCAKEWVNFSLLQGALLDDTDGLFEPTNNKAMRTIKIKRGEDVPAEAIARLIKQTVANNIAGKKVDFKRPKPGERTFAVPHKYESILKENGMWDEYSLRPYYQQKGYVQWIESAKQQVTKDKRIKTMLFELKSGQYMPSKS
jgi:hypothetical protein